MSTRFTKLRNYTARVPDTGSMIYYSSELEKLNLIHFSSEWGGLNLFDLATIIEAKNFIAHAAYQSYLTDLWMGQLKPTIHAGRVSSDLLLG